MGSIKKYPGIQLPEHENNIRSNENFSFNLWKAELSKELPTFWKIIKEQQTK